jgi:hypothetical protein
MSISSSRGLLSAGRPSARNKEKLLSSLSEGDTQAVKRVNFDLPLPLHARLKVYAAKQGKTVKELLTAYVEQLPEA